jgi:hypothetical protein
MHEPLRRIIAAWWLGDSREEVEHVVATSNIP